MRLTRARGEAFSEARSRIGTQTRYDRHDTPPHATCNTYAHMSRTHGKVIQIGLRARRCGPVQFSGRFVGGRQHRRRGMALGSRVKHARQQYTYTYMGCVVWLLRECGEEGVVLCGRCLCVYVRCAFARAWQHDACDMDVLLVRSSHRLRIDSLLAAPCANR